MITKLNYKDRSIRSFAIRKLTPRECFRLMGVRDATIDIMQSDVATARQRMGYWLNDKQPDYTMAISASQQYKQAGNSIVVDVLAHIYESLWYPKKNTRLRQTSIFDILDPESVVPSEPPVPYKGENVHILTTFSGYDSQLMAADALRETHPDFSWDCVGWCDIDRYAIDMHNLVFPQYADKALGDVTKIDWHKVKQDLNGEEVDLFTYSSPCQDISQAGKQMGLKEGSGSRSSLLWNVADAVEVLKPKYLLQENVAALVSEKFMPDFQKWLKKLDSLGYVNRWALVNAKDHGVPQNRLRVFCLSMRRDVAFDYQFPKSIPLEKKLEDVLEDEVSPNYFLKDSAVATFLKSNEGSDACFCTFGLEPTHENAMMIKTYLQLLMADIDGWSMSEPELFVKIAGHWGKFKNDWRRVLSSIEGFNELYEYNLARKKDEPEREPGKALVAEFHRKSLVYAV